MNCVVRAKILKDILVNWGVLGATIEVLGHLFVIAVKPDGTILALNVFGGKFKDEDIELHIQDIDSFIQSNCYESIPVVRDNVSRLYYGGLSLGAWMHMISLNPDTDKDISEGFQNKIKNDFMKGTIFFQPFIVLVVNDKFERTLCVLLPSELTGNEYDSLKKLDTDLYNVAIEYIFSRNRHTNYQGKCKLSKIIDSLKEIIPGEAPIFTFKSALLDFQSPVLWRNKYMGYDYWKNGKEKCSCVKVKMPLKYFIV